MALPCGLVLAGATALGYAAGPVKQPTPRRIVSLNLCADQLVVALADRSQIAGLTRNVTDRQMSAVADQVGDLPVMNGSAEEVLAANPDMIIGRPAGDGTAATALRALRYRQVDLMWANSFADIVTVIRQIAQAVGHPDRGEAMIAQMKRDLARVRSTGRGRVAAYYQRRGYMTGAGTLVDDLMRHVGLVNLATRIGKPPLAQVSLEEMVAARPDMLILETATDRVADQGTEMLHHPALRAIPRIYLPEAWTVCGGPAYVKAARSLAAALAR